MRQVCQPVPLRGIGPVSDNRHALREMTLKEPVKPSVNHNFHTPTESGGNDRQERVKTHQEKDQN